MKRRELRARGRQRLTIAKKVDRGEQMLEDPDKYFAEARARALAEVRKHPHVGRHASA